MLQNGENVKTSAAFNNSDKSDIVQAIHRKALDTQKIACCIILCFIYLPLYYLGKVQIQANLTDRFTFQVLRNRREKKKKKKQPEMAHELPHCRDEVAHRQHSRRANTDHPSL